MKFSCIKCASTYPLDTLKYRCDCGGLFDIKKDDQEEIDLTISLGEVKTPIVSRDLAGVDVHLKLDYMMPTGSFKDRGALALINKLKELGITEVVEDSSGNAGASIAAYCAAAGIKCNIYLPASTSEGKIKQSKAYGANIVKVKGSRDDTAKAVLKAAEDTYYASHVYNPLFFEGTKSIAYEIYEQVGVPDYIFSPVGNGTMLLGIYKGFLEIGKLPSIIGVQAANCCPIYNKYKGIENLKVKETLAEGIAIEEPMRMNQIINAIEESSGDMVKVLEEKIKSAHSYLSSQGIYVELTSATTVAGARQYVEEKNITGDANVVIPLTGIGLKK